MRGHSASFRPAFTLQACGQQAPVEVLWEAAQVKSFSGRPTGWEGSKEEEGEHMGGVLPGRNHVVRALRLDQCCQSRKHCPGEGRKDSREVGRRPGRGRACWAGCVTPWALPQGRILLGPAGVPLRRVDVQAANGVIHVLEGILLPPTILPILPKHCSQEQHKIVVVSARRTAGLAETQCCLCRGRPRGWADGGSGPGHRPQTRLDSPTSPAAVHPFEASLASSAPSAASLPRPGTHSLSSFLLQGLGSCLPSAPTPAPGPPAVAFLRPSSRLQATFSGHAEQINQD